jgi:hypothetical protein
MSEPRPSLSCFSCVWCVSWAINFDHLYAAAEVAKQRKLSDLELIQAFEFTHEIAWNTLKDFLESRGATSLYGSKDAAREAFAKGLIANGGGVDGDDSNTESQ